MYVYMENYLFGYFLVESIYVIEVIFIDCIILVFSNFIDFLSTCSITYW